MLSLKFCSSFDVARANENNASKFILTITYYLCAYLKYLFLFWYFPSFPTEIRCDTRSSLVCGTQAHAQKPKVKIYQAPTTAGLDTLYCLFFCSAESLSIDRTLTESYSAWRQRTWPWTAWHCLFKLSISLFYRYFYKFLNKFYFHTHL